MSDRADYGIDAPPVIRNLLISGVAAFIVAALLPPIVHIGPVAIKLRIPLYIYAFIAEVEVALMLLYSRVGKFMHAARMLNSLQWRGDEQVLDVGTGRGLLAIAASKRLTIGKAIGIDIWQSSDLSGNDVVRTRRNAETEGVADKVEFQSQDARKLTFPDAAFDVVLSNLCVHNIPTREGRDAACREMARVLKPGGTILLSDFKNTADYERVLKDCGLRTARSGLEALISFPPLRTVRADKPRV